MKLLYSTGHELENSVLEAFRFIGFKNIKKGRSPDKEDCVLPFHNTSEFELGVIEVKGVEEGILQKHLDQCERCVLDYMDDLKDGKKIKGIFISNQYRKKPYPDSRNERTRFQKWQLDFAIKRENLHYSKPGAI